MKKILVTLLLTFTQSVFTAQIKENIFPLNSMENLLTDEVKNLLDENIKDKRVIFLGESDHNVGSDFKAKTEFIKYLVLEKGYKDIAFESDFFALYFDHDKKNLLSNWSDSVQCQELFKLLKDNNVTIWGFDNQIATKYTKDNFASKLSDFITKNSVEIDPNFVKAVDLFFNKRAEFNKVEGANGLKKINVALDNLLASEKVIKNKLWYNILNSYKTYLMIITTHSSFEKGIPIRDHQMAQNLDFLVKSMPEKKIMVWLHNAHMSKDNYIFTPGETMGSDFVKMNPEISYHIAFSAIHLKYRKPKMITKYSNDEENLLHFLPDTENNYFLDARKIVKNNPEYLQNQYDGMFNLENINNSKTNWFSHYDALVFISKGEMNKYL